MNQNQIDEYVNFDGDVVKIEELSDEKLVAGYKFFKKYCDVLGDMLSSKEYIPKDGTFANYISNMIRTKEALRNSVQRRKLKLNKYP